MATENQNELARRFRQLHQPGNPVVLTNCYDIPTAATVVAHPATTAVATASYALAGIKGVPDNDLTLDANLAGIRRVASVVGPAGLPLTADLQDGYEDVAATIRAAIAAGAVGCNIEDLETKTERLRSVEDAVSRIKIALAAAREVGVPDFVINARTDVMGFGGTVDDAIARGRAYLAAGAVTCYVWSGPGGKGISKQEIETVVKALGGMINVRMKLAPGYLTVKELREIGVARISVGPDLYHKAMQGFKSALDDILTV